MSETCTTCGHPWFLPHVYYDADMADEPNEAYVPVRVALTSGEAFEHVLLDQSDWSFHEELRTDIGTDWQWRGVVTVGLDDLPDPEECHRFVFAPDEVAP